MRLASLDPNRIFPDVSGVVEWNKTNAQHHFGCGHLPNCQLPNWYRLGGCHGFTGVTGSTVTGWENQTEVWFFRKEPKENQTDKGYVIILLNMVFRYSVHSA